MSGNIVSTLLSPRTISPLKVYNGIVHDVPLMIYPNRALINVGGQRGYLPLWGPHSGIDQPGVNDLNRDFLSPTTLAFNWLSPGRSLRSEA